MIHCPLCGTEGIKVVDLQGFFAKKFTCDICGVFIIEDDAFKEVLKGINKRSNIFYYITHKLAHKYIPHFHMNNNWENGIVIGSDRMTISINQLEDIYPKDFAQKLHMTLLNIATVVKYIGNTFQTGIFDDNKPLYPLFWVDEKFGEKSYDDQFEAMMDMLQEEGYIKHVQVLGDNQNTYTLTALGWDRVDRLQTNQKILPQAFIAMWFDDTMKRAREKIFEAIRACGYIPSIIDLKEHNNQIIPEIFNEIQQCSFMIADLTGQRSGVYYEAGYGQAIGKEVILCCRKDDFNNRHFDVAQKNTIVWENEYDLCNRLISRIKATIGENK